MTNPRDTLRDARARMKPLVARLLARRDQAQATLDASIEERAKLAAEVEAMRGGGRSDLADELTAGLADLDARIQSEREAVALADQHFREGAADMTALAGEEDDAERDYLRGQIDALRRAPGDIASDSPEDVALRNVREHAASLEGIASLNDELARKPAAPARPSAEDAEAKARAELEQLKATRTKSKKTL